jgi:tripartite-type tricarboxylate transporter receptor subunit TctC
MPTRAKPLPDVPTVAESGYKDVDVDAWFGAFAPAGTPKDVVSQFAEWFTAAMQAPEVKLKLVGQELYPVGICGSDFAAHIRKQYDYLGRIIRNTHIETK